MKFRNLLFVMTACAGLFTACSNEMDNAIDNGTNEEVTNAEAYAAISFTMPNVAATRAADKAVGSSEENQITKVVIALFDAATGTAVKYERTRAEFTPDASVGGYTTYSLKSDAYLPITTAGTYNVHVIVNPTSATSGFADLTSYNTCIEAVAKKTGEYCTDNQFMMTNADGAQSVAIATTHTKANPASVIVKVERVAAKIAFDNSNNNTKILNEKGEEIGTVTFDAYKVVNTRNSSWALRRVGTDVTKPEIGGVETNDNYVFENLFADKGTYKADFYEANYSRKLTKYVAFRKLNQTSGSTLQTIAYCMENTLEKRTDQNKGYTTGIILRGKVALNENNMTGTPSVDGTFYRYNRKFYASWNDLLTKNPSLDLQKDVYGNASETEANYKTRISNDKLILNKLSIELYAQGYCYYFYWLTHRPDADQAVVGMMEYVTVRNNVYTLKINSVKSIGNFESGTPGAPDKNNPDNGQEDVENDKTNPELPGEVSPEQEPETPVQPVDPKDPITDNNMYLKMTIEVNPWTVRANNIDL